MFKQTATAIALATAMGAGIANTASADVVDNSFYPYRDNVPTFEGLSAGMTINASNVEQFKDVLDPATYEQLKNGWWEMKVGETTSFDLYEGYVNATRDGLGKVSLGDELGQINGFVAGRPFPEEPSADDPRAGEKLAWNYKYGYR